MPLSTSPFVDISCTSARCVAGAWTDSSQLRDAVFESSTQHQESQPSAFFTSSLCPQTTLAMDWRPESPVVLMTWAEAGAQAGAAIRAAKPPDLEMSDASTCSDVDGGTDSMDWEPCDCVDQDNDTLMGEWASNSSCDIVMCCTDGHFDNDYPIGDASDMPAQF